VVFVEEPPSLNRNIMIGNGWTSLLLGLAYFVSAYKEPESIIRLVNVLANESDHFYVHFDNNLERQRFEQWKRLIEQGCRTQNVHVFSKFRCKWMSFGIVDATLDAMSFFGDFDYNYFINLTGECYPLKSRQCIREVFRDQHAGFLTYWKLPYEGWHQGGMNRIGKRTFLLPKRGYPFVRMLEIPRLRKKIPCDLEPYGGWSLFCLPKDIASYLLKFNEDNPEVRAFFRRVQAPGEMFFQTILLNSHFRDRIVNDNKRYMDFVDSHPRTLTKDDFEALVNSGKLFARKFDPAVDSEILDRIDREIIART